MLKSLAVAYEDEVCQYVLNRMSNMPGTALRYAIENSGGEETRSNEAGMNL